MVNLLIKIAFSLWRKEKHFYCDSPTFICISVYFSNFNGISQKRFLLQRLEENVAMHRDAPRPWEQQE